MPCKSASLRNGKFLIDVRNFKINNTAYEVCLSGIEITKEEYDNF